MGRKTTPSFIVELPLQVSDAERAILQARLDVARQIYNACLGESLRRLQLKRQSKAFLSAIHIPKDKKKERQTAFKQVNTEFGFREYDLHEWAKQFSSTWLNQHIDSSSVQKLASRAFKAVQDYSFGKRGRPRFKGKNQLDSIEGKSNATGLRWHDNQVKWSGLSLPAIIDWRDEIIDYGLSHPVKYMRLVRRKQSGKARFYAQLICEGQPHRKEKHNLGKGKVGLDLGPSTIAGVSIKQAFLLPFCADIDPKYAELRRMQRKLDRQRRANNPENYEKDGTITAGKKQWHSSNRMQKNENEHR